MSVAVASQLDFDRFRATPLQTDPFPYLFVPGFLRPDALPAVNADYPEIDKPGSFPVSELTCGPAFQALLDEMNGPEMTAAFAEKFDIDLSDHPIMITVRGHAQKKDGRIHTDSTSKFLTCLLYLNDIWDEGEARLRMLRNPNDIDDFAAEIPPNGGTLASFLRADNSWHGHEPYVGERRYVMFNWMTSDAALQREIGRHEFSAKVKQLNPFA